MRLDALSPTSYPICGFHIGLTSHLKTDKTGVVGGMCCMRVPRGTLSLLQLRGVCSLTLTDVA